MSNSKDFMTKKFGASGINRKMFIDCFVEEISMGNVPDDVMQTIADNVENYIRERFPEDADRMFELWTKRIETDMDYDIMLIKYREAWDLYWESLERFALTYGGSYINNPDVIDNIDLFRTNLKSIQANIDNILEGTPCGKHLTRQLLSIKLSLIKIGDDFESLIPEIKKLSADK